MSETKLLSVVMQERVIQLGQAQTDPDKYRPISTGIRDLDQKLFGGFPRDPFYFALIGTAKAGKSTIGLNLALNFCAHSGRPMALYMLEEINREVADRVLARASTKVSRSKIFGLHLTNEDFEDMGISANDYSHIPFYVNDSLFDVDEIYEDAAANGIYDIVIDNLQLCTQKARDERTSIALTSNTIMRKRKEGFTTYVVSQGNDKGESFGSTQVRMDANITIGIKPVREDEKDKKSAIVPSMRRLTVLRSRFSPQDVSCDIFFDGNHSRILQLEDKKPESEDMIDFLDEHQPPEDIEE